MPGKRVGLHLSEEALQDIEAILAWYESQAAWQASENVLMTILDSIESLVDHPEAGTVGASGNRERGSRPFLTVSSTCSMPRAAV